MLRMFVLSGRRLGHSRLRKINESRDATSQAKYLACLVLTQIGMRIVKPSIWPACF